MFGSWDCALEAAGVDPQTVRLRRRPWIREEVVQEIRRKKEAGEPVNAGSVSTTLRSIAVRLFGCWDAALKAAGLDPAQIRVFGIRPTAAEIIRELQRKNRAGDALSSNKVMPRRLHSRAVRAFGSWTAALKAAGIDPRAVLGRRQPSKQQDLVRETKRRHEVANADKTAAATADLAQASKPQHAEAVPDQNKADPQQSEIIRGIQQLALANVRLNSRHVRTLNRPLLEAAIRCFGSWPNVLKTAGIDPKIATSRRTWTAADVLAAIRQLDRKGVPLNYASVLKVDGGLIQAAIKLLGSWTKALQAAGYDPEALRVNRHPWTREQIIDLIRSRAAAGLPVASYNVKPASAEVASRRLFGSWKRALRAAGVASPMTEFPVWTKVSVVEAILMRQETGQPVHCLAAAKQASRLYDAARRCFGSWREALEAAGIEPAAVRKKRRPYAREELIETVRRKRTGKAACYTESFRKAARRMFGSWDATLEAGGL